MDPAAPTGNAVKDFFGLKGRFCQPRPNAWDFGKEWEFDPERVVHILPIHARERPFQGRCPGSSVVINPG
jgi:hypothetical protein